MLCPVCDKRLPIQKICGTMEIICDSCESYLIFTVEINESKSRTKQDRYDLIINLKNPHILLKGYLIPTSPPDNLTPQQLGALYILAKNAGYPMTPEEIWSKMEEEGLFEYLTGKPSTEGQAPESKHLRFGILNVFRKNINGHLDIDVDSLIETISNPRPARPRLNLLPRKVLCTGLK